MCISSVAATDPNIIDSNVIDTDLNNNPLNNISSSVNTVYNDPINSSDISCGPSSFISVLNLYNKTVDVNTAINDTNTVNGVTTAAGLVNAFNKYGFNCSVLKTNSLEDLKILCKDNNVIVHMFIKNNYHYGHIKEIRKDGISFNNGLFICYDVLNDCFTGIVIIINKDNFLKLNCFSVNVDKSEWFNISGKLSQRELFKYNYGLIGESIIINKEYNDLKNNIKDESKIWTISSLESILFGNTLKPKMSNLVKIQAQLKPIYNDPNASIKMLNDLNNILTPMQNNLNDTISSLDYLINMMNKHYFNNTDNHNLKSYSNPNLKHFNYGSSIETITENPVIKNIYDLFITFINCLNPVNWLPDEKKVEWGVKEDHKVFGIYTVYSYNINHNNTTNITK